MIGTLTDYTGSRSKSTDYQNTTGEDIFVLITGTGGANTNLSLNVGSATTSYSVIAHYQNANISYTMRQQIVGIVPPDYYYNLGGSAGISYWWEYTTQEVSASSSGTSTEDIMYTGPNMQEWLFVSAVIIFFVSLIAWRHIFGFFKRFREDD